MGSVTSWEHSQTGLIPGLAGNCGSDLIPGPGTPYASGQLKKGEKKNPPISIHLSKIDFNNPHH